MPKRNTAAESIKQPKFNRATQSHLADARPLDAGGSVETGRHYLQWLLDPLKLDQFFNSYWEKNPILVKRTERKYFDKLLSAKTIDEILRKNIIEYTKNVDITSYKDGVRETHNPEGRVMPSQIWNFYDEGCSIRFLNPQTFIEPLHELNAAMQEFFHSFVGANLYLTPPNNQGFAPHYDDIEAFVLQIEGKKRWRLYAPPSPADVLARNSSANFTQEEIGTPIMETVLEPGDLLYFPRGIVHQAHTVPGSHSLHITLSVYQKNAYADLFETLMPNLLKKVIDKNVEFRRGLPLNIWNNFGFTNSDTRSSARSSLAQVARGLMLQLAKELTPDILDVAVDQMAIKFQHDALPPVFDAAEARRTAYGTAHTLKHNGEVKLLEMPDNVAFRLSRANILRMVRCEDNLRIHYHADNTKEYHEMEMNFIEVEEEAGVLIEYLIKSYPRFSKIQDLPTDAEAAHNIVYELWSRGLIMTEEPIS